MSLLHRLKSVTANRPAPVSPIARRRDMLITKLNDERTGRLRPSPASRQCVRANAQPQSYRSGIGRKQAC